MYTSIKHTLIGSLLVAALSIFVHGSSLAAAPVLGHSVYGTGPEKVIVLHDWMGSASNYETVIPYLDPHGFTWVFAEVRGYGLSRHLKGEYTVEEVAADVFNLADSLGWTRFHVVGHSMNGMSVQRMAIDDWTSGTRRLKSVVAVTPVTADGYPADEDTRTFLWNTIHNRGLSEQAFTGLTGKRLLPAWGRLKASRNLASSTPEAMQGYYKMWLDTDFSGDARKAALGTPLLVIGGRQDFPGFSEAHYRKTLVQWYPSAEFTYISDAGHYPMQETPVYFASLLENFVSTHSQ